MKVIRIFPRKTKATPIDKNVRINEGPGLFDEADKVHVSVTFTWDLKRAEYLYNQWKHVAPTEIGGPALNQVSGEFEPGLYLKEGYTITSRGCPNKCWFCLSPDTKILMIDLSVKQINDIRVGDKVIGFQKKETEQSTRWYFVESDVIATHSREAEAYKITLENGQNVICSGDHQWLTPNRGWKHTTGTMGGKNQRPYLTLNNKIKIIGNIEQLPEETDDYKKGYISGMVHGDGMISHYPDKREGFTDQYRFRLALTDTEALQTTKEYLEYFGIRGIKTRLFSEKTEKHRESNAIFAYKKSTYEIIKNMMNFSKEAEYMRGYVAGFFDAEGSYTSAIRLYNTDRDLLIYCEKALRTFNFRVVREQHEENCGSIRVVGGLSEELRFYQIFVPKIKRKWNKILLDKSIKNNSLIISIVPVGKMQLFDITTTTETFIANGMCSHNCSVWKREPELKELEIKPGWNVTDDNLLACSDQHIKDVFAMLQKQKHRIEFTGGIEAALLKPWHIDLLTSINLKRVFCAYDTPDDYEPLVEAGKLFKEANITHENRKASCYVLIGYPKDTITDAMERIKKTLFAGFTPFAMLWRNDEGEFDYKWKPLQREWANPIITAVNCKKILHL